VPAPDPLQYPASSGSVISSSQWNSNFWKSYNDINAIAGSLNSCSYAAGTAVTSVVATSPLVASIGGCNPGVGSQMTLSLAGGTTFPAGKFSATNAQDGYNWPGAISAAGDTISLGALVGGIGSVTCDSLAIRNTTVNDVLMCVDAVGNGVISGDWHTQGNEFVTGTSNAAAVNASGNVVSGGTVQGALVQSTGNVLATGTVQGATVNSTGNMSAAGTVQGSTVNSTGNMTATGTVQGATVTSTGSVTAATQVKGATIVLNSPNRPVPYDVEGSPSSLTPFNHTSLAVLYPAHNSFTCFSKAYDHTYLSTPHTWYSFGDSNLFTGGASVSMIYDNGSTNSNWAWCIAGTAPPASNITTTINLFAIGQ
jgi:hypothetical protein